jgi:hypothetical protein
MCMMAGAMRSSKRVEEVAAMLTTRASVLLQTDPSMRDSLPAELRAHTAAMAVACIENYPSSAGPRGPVAQLDEFMSTVLRDSVGGTPPAPLAGYHMKQRIAAFFAREGGGATTANATEAVDLIIALHDTSEIADPRASSYWAEKRTRTYLIPAITPGSGGATIADAASRARLIVFAPRLRERWNFLTDTDLRLLGLDKE